MDTVFAFDIETVPDVEGGRRIWGLEGLSDRDVAEAMFQKRRQADGTDFLRPHLHRVVAISCVMRSRERCKVWSLGAPDSPERELIARFYDGLGRYVPVLVSWNGGGFDLPVLHYRALIHGVSAPAYWEVGDTESSFRWNNYLNRFHWRHLDLMDVLAGYQNRAVASLEDVACLLGLPGKMGMHGSKVWDAYLDGEIEAIRDYCETDALNTYLVYLRFQLMRGRLDEAGHREECALVEEALAAEARPHLASFLAAWKAA